MLNREHEGFAFYQLTNVRLMTITSVNESVSNSPSKTRGGRGALNSRQAQLAVCHNCDTVI